MTLKFKLGILCCVICFCPFCWRCTVILFTCRLGTVNFYVTIMILLILLCCTFRRLTAVGSLCVETFCSSVFRWRALSDNKGESAFTELFSSPLLQHNQFKFCDRNCCCRCSLTRGDIRCESKKQGTLLMSITSQNIDNFLKFFYC